ncbi:ABC transporter substrate-binding protein [Pseudomonas turukhanskensis]|uniref:ABC transporter n=1 Tax=Pseudomonas turukhanskensis TaxID=1806536 RepID=A0A9W6K526_9PSED|nr:ABC transporter substrate-binding protein [Pseudomonas turukhanskensis]GLK88952.1 ABC transporter [Pseudomonas turukhanskensis]
MKAFFDSALSLFASPLLAGLLGVLPFAASAAPEPLTQIRIAVPDLSAVATHSGGGLVDVVRDQQLFEKALAGEGIKVQWNFFKGAGPAINEAFANGQVDLAYLGDLAAIVGRSNGLDTRLLSATARDIKLYLGVVPGSGIKTLADLKGKRVGIFRGTAAQLSFDAALVSQGLTEKDLKVINLDFTAATSAIVARQIDATWGASNLTALRARGLVDIPLTTKDLNGAGSIQSVLVGAGAFVDAHPDIVKRLLKAQETAQQWVSDEANKDAYIQLVSTLAGYPPVILQSDLGDEKLGQLFQTRLDPEFLRKLDGSIKLASQQRLIRKPFNTAEWVAKEVVAPQPAVAAQ